MFFSDKYFHIVFNAVRRDVLPVYVYVDSTIGAAAVGDSIESRPSLTGFDEYFIAAFQTKFLDLLRIHSDGFPGYELPVLLFC